MLGGDALVEVVHGVRGMAAPPGWPPAGRNRDWPPAIREGGETESLHPSPRLLDQVRIAIRTRHYSRRTEKAYAGWIRRFILFHGKRHPADMGANEVTRFLSHLATAGRVSASTQNQALSALLFLYRDMLQLESRESEGRTAPAARGRPSGWAARWAWRSSRCCSST